MGADPVTIGIKVGMMALQMGLTAMNKIEGPRLSSLDVTTADYGTTLDYFWGKRRLEGRPIIWAEKLREKKSTSKTKGGKYADYKYFGTFAVAIADHEINAVTRIWMDKHLVYDVTKAGPISPVIGLFSSIASDSPVKITNGRNMRIYLGTETQLPDPRMEAWCEDRYGPDSCPAYRGVSYIVFQDLPLEKFGNRIPQITVEAVNDSTPNRLHQTFNATGNLGPVFSADHTRALFYNSSGHTYDIWDVPSNTQLISGTLPTTVDEAAYSSSGHIWIGTGTLGDTLRLLSADGNQVLVELDVGGNADRLTGIGGRAYLRTYAGGGTTIFVCTTSACVALDVDFVPEMFFGDLDGNAWAIGMAGTNIRLYGIDTGVNQTIASPGGVTGSVSAFVNTDGNFFVIVETTAMVIDADTYAVTDSASISGSAAQHFNVMGRMVPGSSRFYTDTKEIDAATLDTLQTYTMGSWTAGNTNVIAYEPVTHSLWGGGSTITIRYLDRIGSVGTDLGDIVQDVADRCGVVELDVTALTQTVTGYSTVQGAGKDWISPLLDIHDVDMRPHDFAVQGLVRGSSAAGTIPVSEFVRDGDEPRYSITIKQDTDLPRRISLSFADADKDQQKNTVLSQRPLDGTDGDREQTIDLTTYVATPGEAQKFSDRFFRRKWNGRESVANSLTAQYLALEPGDVWNLQLDDVTQSHRLVKSAISQGRINTEWERDFPGLATLGTGTGAEMDGRDDDEIYVPSQTKGFVLDTPLVTDSHDNTAPQIYYAAGKYAGDWPGAVIFQANGDEFDVWNTVDSASGATWGYANGALAAPSSPWVWDRGNTVNIKTFGTLTSSTEAAINANPLVNLAYLGGELINFATATLEGDGTYTLTNLKRGRRGTEWACDDHAAGDEFVLVEDLEREAMGLSQVGLSFEYRAQTLGRDVSSAPPIDVDFTGATLKPYAPANLKAARDFTTGVWTITGTRRTRVGGAWVSGTTIPLSEASEDYDIVIVNNDGAELRELTATFSGDGAFTATYSASDQVSDFGSVQSVINVVAYQLSDAVGRGFPATLQATASGELETGDIVAGAVSVALNANVTPVNPAHQSGDTLLCVVVDRGASATVACSTTGWTAADGISNPVAFNGSQLWFFQNEADSDSELDPALTVTGGTSQETIIAVVLRIPGRNTAANFVLGTVSNNASNNNSIAFGQDSPSIDNGNAIIAIGVKNNEWSAGAPQIIAGVTAGLDWTEIVDFKTIIGSDTSFVIDYAVNDSGSAYTAGTGGSISLSLSVSAPSAGVYLEVPLL